MKDHNDFFDELIDVDDESEVEAEEYFGEDEDGEEEEDDDSSVVRTTVLTKNDLLALLSLKTSSAGGMIVRYDPREPLPTLQRYETDDEALKWFKRSLTSSRRNGWAVVYDGEPLFG